MRVKNMTLIAMFVCLNIIFTRIVKIETPLFRISFAFLPMMIAGRKLGVLQTGLIGLISDAVGIIMFPNGFPYFVGFTITAVASGCVYGLLYYMNKKQMWLWITGVSCVITFVNHTLLNSLWLSMTMKQPMWTLITTRLPGQLVMLPVMVITGGIVIKQLEHMHFFEE